jgi:uncharacterized Zn finger protein
VNPEKTVVSFAGKYKVDFLCTRCSKNFGWAWVIKYRGYHFTRVVYLCPACGTAMKVATQESCTGPPPMVH